MRAPHRFASLVCVIGLVAACEPYRAPPAELTSDLPIPEGLEPPEKNTALPPDGAGNTPYPETLNTAFGEMPGGVASVHGRGFVLASLDAVHAAMREVDPLLDRRKIDHWTTVRDVDTTFPFSADVTNTVVDLATFDYVSQWRGARVAESADHPEFVAFRQHLAEPNLYMTSIDDSVIARAVSPQVTLLEFVRHTKTIATGEREAEQNLHDIYASLVARAHVQPLPVWTK